MPITKLEFQHPNRSTNGVSKEFVRTSEFPIKGVLSDYHSNILSTYTYAHELLGKTCNTTNFEYINIECANKPKIVPRQPTDTNLDSYYYYTKSKYCLPPSRIDAYYECDSSILTILYHYYRLFICKGTTYFTAQEQIYYTQERSCHGTLPDNIKASINRTMSFDTGAVVYQYFNSKIDLQDPNKKSGWWDLSTNYSTELTKTDSYSRLEEEIAKFSAEQQITLNRFNLHDLTRIIQLLPNADVTCYFKYSNKEYFSKEISKYNSYYCLLDGLLGFIAKNNL